MGIVTMALFTCKRASAMLVASLVAAATITLQSARADTPPKWGAHLDFDGRWGNKRSLGEAGLFAPLWQNSSSLLFADIRTRFDTDDGREGNFGAGLRHMLPSGWNIGAYGYYDARHSPLGNNFQQVTFGVEALSPDFDLRGNVYVPFGSRTKTLGNIGGAAFADFAGGTIQIVTPGVTQSFERALTGFDGEIGWRLPLFPVESVAQLRAYAGGFFFDGDNLVRDIAGPRGRLEYSIDGLPGLSSARLTLGGEIQHDDVRGTQAFAIARLRVPLGQPERAAPTLTAQERRMTERVVRDIDVVSGEGRRIVSTTTRENAINTLNDAAVTGVVQVDAGAGHTALQNALANGGQGSVVILNGALGHLSATTTIGQNQTLLGGGTALMLKGTQSGTLVNFVAPGAAGKLEGAVAGSWFGTENAVVTLWAGSVVGGLTIVNTAAGFDEWSSHGIYARNASRAVAFGNTITTAGEVSHGIVYSSSDGGIVSGNKVATNNIESLGIYFANSNGGTITNNNVITTNDLAHAIQMTASHSGTIRGNTIVANGLGSAGLIINGGAGWTVRDNVFGPIKGNVIWATGGASFTADSTGNAIAAGTSNGPRCAGGVVAPSGIVGFADGITCGPVW